MITEYYNKDAERINHILREGARSGMTEQEFFEAEISAWKQGQARKEQMTGEAYYDGQQDILKRKRLVIGVGGKLEEADNLPNNLIMDNQYEKIVDQKVNYLLGNPLTIKTENEPYGKQLKRILDNRFMLRLSNVCEDSLNGGIGWLHIYYDELGELRFKRFESYEILPFWKDAEHMELDCVLRLYEVELYDGGKLTTEERVEIYRLDGVSRYILEDGRLTPTEHMPYIVSGDGKMYNWQRIPFVPFKYNDKEKPLISRVKSLQDGLNMMMSDFMNNMQEDSRNTILILQNYQGEDLGEFRRNLSQYGAVKVRSMDGAPGGVDTLEIKVNADNYERIIQLFKKAMIEIGRSYDAKDDRMLSNPNQMNIQSMYSDIDLDANGMEMEYKASFEQLLWFVDVYLLNAGLGDYKNEPVEFIFNRNIMMNEAEMIANVIQSTAVLSEETSIAQHPWVSDVQREMELIQGEREEAAQRFDPYANAFENIGDEDGETTER